MTLQLPERPTLVGEVTKILRRALANGQWRDYVPSERQLSEELHVSRSTLRGSLQLLAEEGLVQCGARARHKILVPPARLEHRNATVVMLSPVPPEQWESRIIIRIDRLRQYLTAARMELLIRHGARFFSSGSQHALQQLVRKENASCWILSGSTAEVQRWFADRKLPAIVMGPCFEGIDLDSIDLDFRAICRHAAGLLIGAGHARIALILRETESAGDHYSSLGFQEAFKSGTRPLDPMLVRYDNTMAGLRRNLDRVFLAERPPTAIIAPARQIVTIVLHLAQRQIIAGRDYAFIARDDDPVLELMVPSVARYGFNPANLAHRLFVAVMKIVQDKHHLRHHWRLMPRFLPGASSTCRAVKKGR